MFRYVGDLGVEGSMISPGYDFEDAPDQDLFLTRQESRNVFRDLLDPTRMEGMRFYNNPLYLNFLRGEREYQCTAWSNPTYTVMGWRKPCYPLADEHTTEIDELYEPQLWEEKYGVGRDPRCNNCMIALRFRIGNDIQRNWQTPGMGDVHQIRRGPQRRDQRRLDVPWHCIRSTQ